MSNKVFAAFDDRKGPIPIYSTLKDNDLSTKIAVKSIVSTLSNRDSQDKVEGDAIIPFPEENMLAFIFYVSLDQKTQTGDYRTISLAYLVSTEESSILYTNAEVLSKSARIIADKINKHYIYGESIPNDLIQLINGWDQVIEQSSDFQSRKQKQIKIEDLKISINDLYDLFPPETGFRKYVDPIGHLILALLYHIPVVLSGPDPKLLKDFTKIIQNMYPLKELSVATQDQIEKYNKINPSESKKVPRADIIILTDVFFRKCKFKETPILILSTYQDSKLLHHSFDEGDTRIIGEWLKLDRKSPNIKFLRENLEYTQRKLDELAYHGKHYGDSTVKDVSLMMKLEKEEVEFCARLILNDDRVTPKELNILFGEPLYTEIQKEVVSNIGIIEK